MTERLMAIQRRLPTLTALIPLVIVWEIVARLEVSFAFPPLADVVRTIAQVQGEPGFAAAVRASLWELGVGLLLAAAVGLCVGIAMGLWRPVEEALDVYVNAFMSAPTAAFVPILIAVFGVGQAAIIATVFLFSVFVLIVNTFAGVRSVDPRLLEMARSFQASRWRTLRRIVIPSAMPMILTGMRLAFGKAVSGMILGEMLIVVVGYGGMIMQAGSAFQVTRLWALVFMVLAFAVVVTRGLEGIQSRTTAWASSTTRV